MECSFYYFCLSFPVSKFQYIRIRIFLIFFIVMTIELNTFFLRRSENNKISRYFILFRHKYKTKLKIPIITDPRYYKICIQGVDWPKEFKSEIKKLEILKITVQKCPNEVFKIGKNCVVREKKDIINSFECNWLKLGL